MPTQISCLCLTHFQVEIGKRSLLGLCIMMSRSSVYKDKEGPKAWKGLSGLQEDESGELAYAKKAATAILQWLNMTVGDAEQFLGDGGNLFSRGEIVKPPGVDGLADDNVEDNILPPF